MKMRSIFMAMALACMSAGEKDLYMQRGFNRPNRTIPKLPPMTPGRERIIMANMERQKHEFHIHGEIIRAKDRKTAIKIYNNKHKRK